MSIIIIMILLCFALVVVGDTVYNGNDTARYIAEGNKGRRIQLLKEQSGAIHSFRYLEIEKIEWLDEKKRKARLETREPSSDIKVVLTTVARKSIKLAHELEKGDCVAAKGRMQKVGIEKRKEKNNEIVMIIKPAILTHKDRKAPKTVGKELLRDIKDTKEAN